jgi:DNA polymerase-1
VRRVLRANDGMTILAFDYGQIEARVIAMFTKDPIFVKALWERYDVHMEWAERIARAYPSRIGGKKNLTDKKAMSVFRGDIKNQWTFPLFFGARLESAAGYLNIPVTVLRPLYDAFWNQFATTKDWQERILADYRKSGHVETLTGRKRRGPLSLNQVCNTPVQGTAAEIVMDAMCRLSETGDPELQPEINIHDDLTFVRVDERRADVVAEKVIKIMLDVPFKFINVPITVELSEGLNWMPQDDAVNPDGMEEVGKFSSDDGRFK